MSVVRISDENVIHCRPRLLTDTPRLVQLFSTHEPIFAKSHGDYMTTECTVQVEILPILRCSYDPRRQRRDDLAVCSVSTLLVTRM